MGPDAGRDRNQKLGRVLAAASRRGRLETVKALLAAGAPVDARSTGGKTPLMLASEYDRAAVVEALLDFGAALEAVDVDGRTPLSWAARTGACEAARILLARGADANRENRFGLPPLHVAAHRGHVPVVEMLLAAGVDLETRDGSGRTPLGISSRMGQLESVRRLLREGALVEVRSAGGKTPLILAAEGGAADVVEALLDAGAGIEVRDDEGLTPLMMASLAGARPAAEILLERGADPLATSRSGHPAHFFAAVAGHPEVARRIHRASRPAGTAEVEGSPPSCAPSEGLAREVLHSVLTESQAPHAAWLWVEGWSPLAATEGAHVRMLLRDGAGRFERSFPCFSVARSDVVVATGRPGLLGSGFRALACLEDLPAGSHTLEIVVETKGSGERVHVAEFLLPGPEERRCALARPVVVSVHIPKTAGLSFGGVLDVTFSGAVFRDYLDPLVPYPQGREHVSQGNVLVPLGADCIHGHFLATKYSAALPAQRGLLWLRDPAQRLVSAFHYASRQAAAGRVDGSLAADLLHYVRSPLQRNTQSRFLDGRALSSFEFVGILEQHERSLALFQRLFGSHARVAPRSVNANPERAGDGTYPLSPEARSDIASLHAEDLELYREGCARFERLCARHGI